jgi:hypothetical protein
VAAQSKSFKNRCNYLHKKTTTPSQTYYDGDSGSTVVSESKILGPSLDNQFELLGPHTTSDTKGDRHSGANIPTSSKGVYTIGRHETANLQGCHQINIDICGANVVLNT